MSLVAITHPSNGGLTYEEAFVKVVILGCGRVGATLATQLDRAGHIVSVIDSNSDSFQRLGSKFRGEKITGNGVDEELLRSAGIVSADAFIAVTDGDNRNIMASQIAKEIFSVKKVVCRIYDPLRQVTFNEPGLEAICPTTIVSDLLLNALNSSSPGKMQGR
jgi:trk system potassium uptake protein TrkA